MNNNNTISISRSESNSIKGLLIMLVIIGHSYSLYGFPMSLRSFMYTFHYHCFFILPFLYPIKPLSKERFKNYIARLIIPYLSVFIITFVSLFVYKLIKGSADMPYFFYAVKAMVMGGYYPLNSSIGIRYIWFLPAMFSMVILKDYYFTSASEKMKWFMIVLGIPFYFFLWVCLKGPFCIGIREFLMNISPLSIWQALGILFISLLTVKLLSIFSARLIDDVFITGLFIILFVLFIIIPSHSIFILVLKAVIPVVAFMMLFSFRKLLSKLKLLQKYGEHSFEIYIVQTPVCVILYTMIPKFLNTGHWYVGVILLFVVISLCYMVAMLVKKIPFFDRFFFPRTWNELPFTHYFK